MATRSRGVWAKLVRQWRESGLSAEAFAAPRGLKSKTLQWWAWNLGSAEQEAARPIEVVEIVHAAAASEQFEVYLENGRCVRVPSAFDSNDLARLLSVLEATP